MSLFILGFMIGGATIMVWAVISQYIAVSQKTCIICKEYHDNDHKVNHEDYHTCY